MNGTAACAAALVLAAWMASAPAAAASSASFTDAAGDATGVDPLPPPAPSGVTSTPRPSEPELDLLRVQVNGGPKILFSATVAAAGIPTTAIGTTFRFLFTYDGAEYQLIAQRPNDTAATTTTSGVFFRARALTSAELSCRDCAVRYDLTARTVTVSASPAALSSGIRQAKPASKPLGPGKSLTGLKVLAQRLGVAADRTVDVGRTLTVDVASGGSAVLTL